MSDLELCPTCGASWECEHRPPARGGPIPHKLPAIYHLTDPQPPVQVRKLPAKPNRVELEENIRNAVMARPGVMVEQLMKDCGLSWQNQDHRKVFQPVILKLIRARMLVRFQSGQHYLHTPALYVTDKQQRLEQAERELGWSREELNHATRRMMRREQQVTKLRREVEALGNPT